MRDEDGYERLAADLKDQLDQLLAGTPDLKSYGIMFSRQRGLRPALAAVAAALAAHPLKPKAAIATLSNRHLNVIFGFGNSIQRRRFRAGDRDPVRACFQVVADGREVSNHNIVIDLADTDSGIISRFTHDAAHMLRGAIAIRRLIGARPRVTTIDRATLEILKSRGITPKNEDVEHDEVRGGYRRGHDNRQIIIGKLDGEDATWKDGVLIVPGSLPHTLLDAAPGRALGSLVEVPAPLAERTIVSIRMARKFRTEMGLAGQAAMKAVLASGPLIHLGSGPTPASTGTLNDSFNNDIHVMMLEITVKPDRVRIDGPVRRDT